MQHSGAADALLFNAARAQLVATVIRPALERGEFVICDRYADSTLAYQGYGSGVRLDALRALAAVSTGGLVPDRTILFDVPVSVGLERRRHGPDDQQTRFEDDSRHDRAFHERVRSGYLAMAAEEPDRWRVVDAARSLEQLVDDVRTALADLPTPAWSEPDALARAHRMMERPARRRCPRMTAPSCRPTSSSWPASRPWTPRRSRHSTIGMAAWPSDWQHG